MKTQWLAFLAAVFLTGHVTAQEDRKESRIAFTKIATSYRVMPARKRTAKLNEEPAIRWTKPAGEIEDAALFFWMCENRPVAAATFLWQKNIGLYQEHPERDGAIFAFVQDTDPEVLLILENRAHGDGTRWEFAIAPMNGWPLIAWHKALKVWSVERRHPAHDPTQTYFVAGPFNGEK